MAGSAVACRWTPELHNKFIAAVNELGGADLATPKAILSKLEVRVRARREGALGPRRHGGAQAAPSPRSRRP